MRITRVRGWSLTRAVLAALALAAVPALLALAAAPARADGLRAGAGRADITPPTGYYKWGWVRSDAVAKGQHTRLYARAIVLESGGRKLALVSVDLGAVPNGMIVDAAERLAGRGIADSDLIVSATHTHSGPGDYFNFPGLNFTAMTKDTPARFDLPGPPDERLYTFLTERLAAAIRRADDDLAPAAAAWGHERLLGITDNRSIEAHLANHGIDRDYGEGSVADDPYGYDETIDPEVNVLRVDKLTAGGRVPIGMWSTFANHGTVVRRTFDPYSGDHHAAASRVAERLVRRTGQVPPSQEVVNAYGNSDEGDMTAALRSSGPADAEGAGRREARAMFAAWREAGARLDPDPVLRWRWTRPCFCGQRTSAGPIDDRPVTGLTFFTGSEDHRGPLYELTGVHHEGDRLPVSTGPQGSKIPAIAGGFPTAVPLTVARIADQVIATVPGEMTSAMGRRLREAVLAESGPGIERIVLSGLANDTVQYFTTPEEYDAQHYEAGGTLYGRASGVFILEQLARLAGDLAAGAPAPAPYPFDPRNGVTDDEPPFGPGAARGVELRQPSRTERLGHAVFGWRGGPRGLDRPLDRAFVLVERQAASGEWRRAASDLGFQIVWLVDDEGRYEARWEPPRTAPPGRYRFAVEANRYRLRSAPFRLRPARSLVARVVRAGGGEALVELRYPHAAENDDYTWRPTVAPAAGARATTAGGGVAVERVGKRLRITGAPGTVVEIARGAARDRFGNVNGNRLRLTL